MHIGTGAVATPAQAQEVHASIRAFMAHAVSPAVASAAGSYTRPLSQLNLSRF
jgi:triosephosphate isomerase